MRFASRPACRCCRETSPRPVGQGKGATPVQLLAAAAGNCLADSLLFALKKFKQSPEPIKAVVRASVGRNESNRLRVQRISVVLSLGVPAASLNHLDRALAQFEDFCTVTGSLRQAFPVDVEVRDSLGVRLR